MIETIDEPKFIPQGRYLVRLSDIKIIGKGIARRTWIISKGEFRGQKLFDYVNPATEPCIVPHVEAEAEVVHKQRDGVIHICSNVRKEKKECQIK